MLNEDIDNNWEFKYVDKNEMSNATAGSICCVILVVVFIMGFFIGGSMESHSDIKKGKYCETNPCTFACVKDYGYMYETLKIKCDGIDLKSLESLLAPL